MLVPASILRRPRPRVAALAAAVVVATAALLGSVATSPAAAMSQPQTTLAGTVNTVFWELDAFWRLVFPNNPSYRTPKIGYYSAPTYLPQCGGTLYDYTIMAYCGLGSEPQIWIHTGVNQGKVTSIGDYAAGFFLAHEWGHHIAKTLGLSFPTTSNRGRELYADCLAGIFTRYAWNVRGWLDSNDYWEALRSLDDRFPNEGGPGNGYPTKADRKAWFGYGYSQYSLPACAQATQQY
jgi:uncharacterized protein